MAAGVPNWPPASVVCRGLFVGPSNSSGELVHVNNLGVRCLRWTEGGLYACGTEPNDPFSVGVSTDRGASFQPIYRMQETCPQACADGTPFASLCEQPWSGIGSLIKSSGQGCAVPWTAMGENTSASGDAGVDAARAKLGLMPPAPRSQTRAHLAQCAKTQAALSVGWSGCAPAVPLRGAASGVYSSWLRAGAALTAASSGERGTSACTPP